MFAAFSTFDATLLALQSNTGVKEKTNMAIGPVREPPVIVPPIEVLPRGSSRQEAALHEVPSDFARLMRNVEIRIDQGETVLREAIAANGQGRNLNLSELIAVQAGVYRYSETVDLLAKLVDHATSGLKTVVQSQ